MANYIYDGSLVKVRNTRNLGYIKQSKNNPDLFGFIDFHDDLYVGGLLDLEKVLISINFICPCCLEDVTMCQKIPVSVVEESSIRGFCDVCEVEKLVKQVVDPVTQLL